MPRVGIVGSLVWDVIHGRDPLAAPVEEWGGIAYALAAMDAALDDDWEFVPLIKVGRDMSGRAAELLRSLPRMSAGGRCVEVEAPNNRVVLHYESSERRCERMAGGVPGWNWGELGPMVRDLDAVYVNFISGYEMCLGTAQALRRGFQGPLYADLHSLFLGVRQDGVRTLRPLPDAPSWFGCFDAVQLNEEEMRQLSSDPLALAADALGAGVRLLVVTLGPRGAAYVADPAFDGWRAGPAPRASAVRTALVPAPAVDALDPTGCGDVFGASLFARLLAGDAVEPALREAVRLASRNATFRGASGLSQHLRGELVTP
ncbi:MAG TPA: carbohydrate kinase family protein [Gemmatimonadales bacterium]|jgi:hypothetical protein|nr:carbohydrate kinase family protein [Gemmatimonadales bacterium]